MPLTRVYLPLTAPDLATLAEGGSLGRPPVPAHAVTPLLGRPGLTTDEEELEHLAWVAATEEAAGLAPEGVRRVVAAADVETEDVLHPTTPDVPSRVELTEPVLRRHVVSFHVDEEPGGQEPTDMLWYDVTELAEVRALVAGG